MLDTLDALDAHPDVRTALDQSGLVDAATRGAASSQTREDASGR